MGGETVIPPKVRKKLRRSSIENVFEARREKCEIGERRNVAKE